MIRLLSIVIMITISSAAFSHDIYGYIKDGKESSDIELRSEKVRNLLGEIPPSLVRWGTVIIVAIFLILLLVVCFMPYPHSQ